MDPIFEIQTDNTKEEKNGGSYSQFIITPLVGGYGLTLGVALRRVLLTSLSGTAITKVKISGVKHQFSTLKGMKEDVLHFLLNLKNVRLDYSGEEMVKLSLSAKEAGEVKASDIKVPANVKIANPDLVLANLSKGAKLEVEMEAEKGTGYSPSEERQAEGVGVIPMDAIFSPVVRVNYKVEETRVGRVTNYDKLTLEITTDGTISPRAALEKAAKMLVSYFTQVVSPKEVTKSEEVKQEKADDLGAVGKLSVEEIGLPTRIANALVKSGYETVDKLVQARKEDLVQVRNLGEKSLKIIKVALKEKGVDFPNA